MPNAPRPTINDFLSRLYVIRKKGAEDVRTQARARVAANTAKGQLQSGATLKALARIIEIAFESAIVETFAVLRHMQSVPEIDVVSCRDQAFLRTRELIGAFRAASGIDAMLAGLSSNAAREVIDQQISRLDESIAYRFRQFDVGLDVVGAGPPIDNPFETRSAPSVSVGAIKDGTAPPAPARGGTMTPTATRLQHRLAERRAWFNNEWFFKWHHIGGQNPIAIELFDERSTSLAGVKFWGSPRDVYWDAISRGLRKEVLGQLVWVEESAKAYDRTVAIQAIEECTGLLVTFAAAIRRAAVEKDRILRGDGVTFPAEEDRGRWSGTGETDIREQAEALSAALFPPTSSPSSAPPVTSAASTAGGAPGPTPTGTAGAPDAKPYQVALSFAGEQRDYVRAVATALTARHISVFYDEFEATTLWGTDGAEHFHRIYSSETRYVVMFISAAYVEKAWTRHERRSAISQQMKEAGEYILPVRFDDTEVPGIPDTMQYLSAKALTPAELAVHIASKLGVAPTAGKASHVPPPSSTALSGEPTFDYGAYNGRFVIGAGLSAFETAWSKAGDTGIYLLNDPPGIHGVAIARGAAAIEEVEDAAGCDFSSRSRRVKAGEVAVLLNTNGFYAAVQVLKVDDDSRGAPSDALTIRYAILPTGEANFAALGLAATA